MKTHVEISTRLTLTGQVQGIEVYVGSKHDPDSIYFITDVPCTTYSLGKYKILANKINWIKTPKVKVWLLTKMIQRVDCKEAMNMYFSGDYRYDNDYRGIL